MVSYCKSLHKSQMQVTIQQTIAISDHVLFSIPISVVNTYSTLQLVATYVFFFERS